MRYPLDIREAITGVVINYKTHDLLKIAIDSIREKYDINIIVVDGSPDKTTENLRSEMVTIIHTGFNIGHGKGINLAMSMVKTPLALIFDSDIKMLDPCLEEMIEAIETPDRKYGIGQVLKVNKNGCNDENGNIEYLHPHFCLIDRLVFYMYPTCIHHGAPFIKAMNSINGLNLLVDYPIKNFIEHKGRGTVKLKPKEFKSHTWEKFVSL